MVTKPTLNSADIQLLTSIFATKEDLVSMEKRQDTKYATKNDLAAMEKRQDAKYASKIDLKSELGKLEKKLIKRMDLLHNSLDRSFIEVAKDVDRIKLHLNLPFSSL